jgi:hypothetical protein
MDRLYFENGIWESGYFAFSNVWEGIFFSRIVDIGTMPIIGITTGSIFIQSIFSNQGNVTIQVNSDRIISWKLEGGAIICYT